MWEFLLAWTKYNITGKILYIDEIRAVYYIEHSETMI